MDKKYLIYLKRPGYAHLKSEFDIKPEIEIIKEVVPEPEIIEVVEAIEEIEIENITVIEPLPAVPELTEIEKLKAKLAELEAGK